MREEKKIVMISNTARDLPEHREELMDDYRTQSTRRVVRLGRAVYNGAAGRPEPMQRRFNLEVELPDDISSRLRDEDLAAKAKEALVMEFLREHRISQGRAAEMLDINRYDLFDLMMKYQIPVIDLTAEELEVELIRPLDSR